MLSFLILYFQIPEDHLKLSPGLGRILNSASLCPVFGTSTGPHSFLALRTKKVLQVVGDKKAASIERCVAFWHDHSSAENGEMTCIATLDAKGRPKIRFWKKD